LIVYVLNLNKQIIKEMTSVESNEQFTHFWCKLCKDWYLVIDQDYHWCVQIGGALYQCQDCGQVVRNSKRIQHEEDCWVLISKQN